MTHTLWNTGNSVRFPLGLSKYLYNSSPRELCSTVVNLIHARHEKKKMKKEQDERNRTVAQFHLHSAQSFSVETSKISSACTETK